MNVASMSIVSFLLFKARESPGMGELLQYSVVRSFTNVGVL